MNDRTNTSMVELVEEMLYSMEGYLNDLLEQHRIEIAKQGTEIQRLNRKIENLKKSISKARSK